MLGKKMKLFESINNRFHTSRSFRIWGTILGYLSVLIFSFLIVAVFILYILPGAYDAGAQIMPVKVKAERSGSFDDTISIDPLTTIEKTVTGLQKQLDKLTPKTNYLVINTTDNRFFLYTGKQMIREGICSTGSYTLLVSGDKKKWEFKTPKGIFKIREKKTAPVWKKPDWAFVEEGLPIPSPNHPSRFEYGSLGDYALSLGDGYMIHGTLYQRFLGMPVTHGCIRLGDADLEVVYHAMPSGARVYIY
jgi:L,D-transpeptidase YbiS